MKQISQLLISVIVIFSFSSIASAGFDWGDGNGQCSGDGTFQQDIPHYDIIEVGEIPSGKQDVFIELISDEDVDIQLYDKSTGEKIVHWPDGILNGPGTQSTNYHGVDVEWSGYNGDGTGYGHEYIRITGTTNRTFVMKAFGYKAGYANVNYSWEGTEGCTGDGGPAESGSGTFQQQIAYYDIVEVGDLVPGLNNVYIELISDEDVDIQLYDGNTKIVHWPFGILSGPSHQSTNYGGMTIEWSGYNGDGTGLGHEYIRITGSVDRILTMKAFGFRAGYATVNYSWGRLSSFNGANSLIVSGPCEEDDWEHLEETIAMDAASLGVGAILHFGLHANPIVGLIFGVIDEIPLVGGGAERHEIVVKKKNSELESEEIDVAPNEEFMLVAYLSFGSYAPYSWADGMSVKVEKKTGWFSWSPYTSYEILDDNEGEHANGCLNIIYYKTPISFSEPGKYRIEEQVIVNVSE